MKDTPAMLKDKMNDETICRLRGKEIFAAFSNVNWNRTGTFKK